MIDRWASRIADLANQLTEPLRSLLEGHDHCALVDFPSHPNVGDSAIWLGERLLLSRLGVMVDYVCDEAGYDAETLRGSVGRGPILIHGGGNLGDLWPNHQRFREQVVDDFPLNRIVQLPQTVNFLDGWSISRASACFRRHSDLTIMVRDQRSYDVVSRQLGCHALLCPDAAFAIGGMPRDAETATGIVWLARTDFESAGMAVPLGASVAVKDWDEEGHRRERSSWSSLLPELRTDGFARFDDHAGSRLVEGCELLSQASTVVTDRLHGHVLSVLLGIPHVVLPDRYGKTIDFLTTWTEGLEGVHRADRPDEALAIAESITT